MNICRIIMKPLISSILVFNGILSGPFARAENTDWLIASSPGPVQLENMEDGRLVFSNGILRRTFCTAPDFATIDLENLSSHRRILRGVKPEALLEIDGVSYAVGGLSGQEEYGFFLPDWLKNLQADPQAFHFKTFEVGEVKERFGWKRKRHSANLPWPVPGKELVLTFTPPDSLAKHCAGLEIRVHYELYQGLPVMGKWISVHNGSWKTVTVDQVQTEILAVADECEASRLEFLCDENNARARWQEDEQYLTHIHMKGNRLEVRCGTDRGPAAAIEPGREYASFRSYAILHDSDDRERRGLTVRRFYRALAPWITENPIMMHVLGHDRNTVRAAVDQCAEVGFEMAIITFWSGFQQESEDPVYLQRMKEDFEYAHQKGVEIGGYVLMCASRDVNEETNCIDPATGKPGSRFGQSGCLASAWSDGFFQRVRHFMDFTDQDVIETDGPYHGDWCASSSHTYHRGLDDSYQQQFRRCSVFYHQCREKGIFVNAPDDYMLQGSNKTAMGYREENWSLPRNRQILLARQNIYDATWRNPVTMGWMFVPLTEYHGGGAAATIEPLSEHLDTYEWHLAQNLGCGVQACYRGPRLYDTDQTKALVKKWVDFYKKYRDILESDLIHVRRADGRDIDCMMHVNPLLPTKGLAMVFNPTDRNITRMLELTLYYTGLTDTARIRREENPAVSYSLSRDHKVTLSVEMDPQSITWFAVE